MFPVVLFSYLFLFLQQRRTRVDKRNSANKIQARGIYPDAIVTRGPGWKYDDQDGGRFGMVTGITSCQGIPASAAKVAWFSGTEGTYRRGYQGKVNCIPGAKALELVQYNVAATQREFLFPSMPVSVTEKISFSFIHQA